MNTCLGRSLLGTSLPFFAIACAPAARSQDAPIRHASQETARPAPPPPTVPRSSLAVIRLTTDSKAFAQVAGELRLEGPLAEASSLRFQPAHDARLEAITARDASGDIALRRVVEGTATKLELGRRAAGWLEVRYTLVFGTSTDGYAPFAEPIELRSGGEDLLVLPDTDARFPVEIHLATGGGGASSFALGADHKANARPSELRGAYFLSGDVGTSTFHTSFGDDFAAWIGVTAFDPRWVSAETAGVRSAVDAYVGRTPDPGAPPVSILFTATRREDPPIAVSFRTHGLAVSADRSAEWTPAVRILVAQALMQRYVGGFLWVGDRNAEASGYFFSEGFSRAIAREILFDGGALPAADRADELNSLLATIAFASDPHRLAAARGALIATAIDVALRTASSTRSLKTFLRDRLAWAANEKKDTLPLPDFVATVRASAGEAVAREMVATLVDGAEVKLPSDLAGPCYRLASRQLVPFELGLVTTSGAKMTIESVKPGSRAEAAGVRVGDVVSEIHYENGRSGVPVKVVVVRDERKVPLRFLPAGVPRPGRLFERVPGVPADRC
jgi:hypothetical protein